MGLLGGGRGLSPAMIEQAVVLSTLLGAADRDQATAVAARLPGLPATVDAGRLAEWLRELYPPEPAHVPGQAAQETAKEAAGGRHEWWGRIRPDRLAELHTARHLAAHPGLLQAAMADLDERQRRQALLTLARAAQELPAAVELLQRLLPTAADQIGTLPASRQTLIALYAALPDRSVLLARAHALLAQRLLHSLPVDAPDAERTRWLENLGIRLSGLGQPDQALAPAQEAVAIWREVVQRNPDRYRPDLATSLSKLGVTFALVGQVSEALLVITEAVQMWRALAQARPAVHRQGLERSWLLLALLQDSDE